MPANSGRHNRQKSDRSPLYRMKKRVNGIHGNHSE